MVHCSYCACHMLLLLPFLLLVSENFRFLNVQLIIDILLLSILLLILSLLVQSMLVLIILILGHLSILYLLIVLLLSNHLLLVFFFSVTTFMLFAFWLNRSFWVLFGRHKDLNKEVFLLIDILLRVWLSSISVKLCLYFAFHMGKCSLICLLIVIIREEVVLLYELLPVSLFCGIFITGTSTACKLTLWWGPVLWGEICALRVRAVHCSLWVINFSFVTRRWVLNPNSGTTSIPSVSVFLAMLNWSSLLLVLINCLIIVLSIVLVIFRPDIDNKMVFIWCHWDWVLTFFHGIIILIIFT